MALMCLAAVVAVVVCMWWLGHAWVGIVVMLVLGWCIVLFAMLALAVGRRFYGSAVSYCSGARWWAVVRSFLRGWLWLGTWAPPMVATFLVVRFVSSLAMVVDASFLWLPRLLRLTLRGLRVQLV